MSYGSAQATKEEKLDVPSAQMAIENFDINLKKMEELLSFTEDRCHRLLNLRVPQDLEKAPTPLESDFISQLTNRNEIFSRFVDRLQAVNRHLQKIVG